MTLNDLEPPSPKEVFSDFFRNFWMQRTFQHWIATKWLEIDQGNLRMKFSAFNVDFSSSSPDPLGSRRPGQAGVKDSYPLKSGYFTAMLSRVLYKSAVTHLYVTIFLDRHDEQTDWKNMIRV